MKKHFLIAAGLLFGALAAPFAASRAFADTLETFTNVAAGDSNIVTLSGDGGNTWVEGWSGRYQGNLNGQDINDFCVDLNHDIYFGQSYTADVSYNVTDASGSQNGSYYQGGLSSALNSGYYSPVENSVTNQERADEVGYLVHSYGNATASTFNNGFSLSQNLTAVSLSIWDIETDGGDGLTSGSMLSDSGTASTYGSLVNTLETQATAHDNDQYLDVKWIQAPIANGGYQSFAYLDAVPEAGTVVTFALMLAGGFLVLWKRRVNS